MSNELRLYIGLKLTDEARNEWRIISLLNRSVTMIQLNKAKTNILTVPVYDIQDLIIEGKVIPDTEEVPVVVDWKRLPESELERMNRYMAFLNEVQAEYGPTFVELGKKTKKDFLLVTAQKYNISKRSMYRIIDKWLKSGLNFDALVNRNIVCGTTTEREYKRRPGVKGESQIITTNEVKEQFQYGINAWLKERVSTMRAAFDMVLMRYYSDYKDDEICLLPVKDRPTFRQFESYLKKVTTEPQRRQKKTSLRDYNNNERIFNHTPQGKDVRPGSQVEIDAMEMDFDVVSYFNHEKNIGRPVLYMLTDRYSHCIVAFNVSFENNSILGMTNLYMNLFDDREFVLQAHKAKDFDIENMPKPFLPESMICDHGSDFASHQHQEICRELGIRRELVEPAMGSMKPLIERSFGLFNTLVLPVLWKHGLIEKRYDSTHARDAELTIEDAYLIAMQFVQWRNTTPMKHYKMSKEMLKAGVTPSPINIWNYGCSVLDEPFPITARNRMSFMMKLLPKVKATITREGIIYKGLVYQNDNPEIIEAMGLAKFNANKKNPDGSIKNSMDVRFDPRSINNLYYEKDGKVKLLMLVPERCAYVSDMTWDEYNDYVENRKELNKKNQQEYDQSRIRARHNIAGIVDNAATGTHSDKSDVRPFRKLDKAEDNFKNRVSSRFVEDDQELTEDVSKRPALTDDKTVDTHVKDDGGNREGEDSKKDSEPSKKWDDGKRFDPFSDTPPDFGWEDELY